MESHISLERKALNAAKWSSITEIVAKIINPISNMVLARILVPEVFGVVATATMIFSFADMFTDAGFQKYLVQHEFKNDQDKFHNADVAFWTNLCLSVTLWVVITIFSCPIAIMVGNPGMGNVIIIACMQLPLTSFSSIQMALYRREFDFKTLFGIRLITILIPFILTIPLALSGLGYWSLIIGTIIGQSCNAIVLTMRSKWKPRLFYSLKVLKEMISFSIWSLVEAISIWLTTWVDAFIIANVLNQYYLGLYKTSITMVNGLLGIITASSIPVLFATLSRLQKDDMLFKKTYFKVQRIISILVFPFGVGTFLYSNLATKVLLGNNWSEANIVIGTWALTSAIMIVFGNLCSEVYRAKGRPKLSFLAQVLHLVVLIPVCIISSSYGFWTLVYARSWIRMEFVLVHFIIMYLAVGITASSVFKNILPTAASAAAMGVLCYLLQQINSGIFWNIISIIICALFYYGMLNLFPNMRKEVRGLAYKLKPSKLKTKSVVSQG